LILVLLVFLMGCVPKKAVQQFLETNVPGETLEPCPVDYSAVHTVRQLAQREINNRATAECANGKIDVVRDLLEGGDKE
jgi:hypothetical protein